jgi:diguanylate cyclase (GGDEF)-like protein
VRLDEVLSAPPSDSPARPAAKKSGAKETELTEAIAIWRELLFTTGDAAARASPPLGPALSQKLSAAGRGISTPPTAESVGSANQQACTQLRDWADKAARFYGQHQLELKEIMTVVARTADTLGQRDERYAQEIGGFATRLREVADQPDITLLRRSIVESAGAVQNCVARMAKEGRETALKLNAQTAEYRRRMEEAERISLIDPLTSVLNRRGMERDLEGRLAAGRPFALALMDLDKFKSINDSFGHSAGDDLLRQLGAELLTQFPRPDAVARLGGDEFVVVSSNASGAQVLVSRLRQWVLGKYRIPDSGGVKVEISIEASIGSAIWDGRETAQALVTRADQLMYQNKNAAQIRSDQRVGAPSVTA